MTEEAKKLVTKMRMKWLEVPQMEFIKDYYNGEPLTTYGSTQVILDESLRDPLVSKYFDENDQSKFKAYFEEYDEWKSHQN